VFLVVGTGSFLFIVGPLEEVDWDRDGTMAKQPAVGD
jgi:hypothetical protein